MLGLVKTQKGVGFMELRECPEPTPKSGEVLLEIKAAGICGTDVHVKHDRFPYWPPVILGHEFSAVVKELGPDCRIWKVGDRVVGEPHTRACGVCYLCRTGNPQICPEKRSPGWGIDGCFAKYLCMPEKLLHRIPDGIDFDLAALAEPLGNTVHDVIERARLTAGDFVVIIGPGPIGLLAGQVAKAGGARHVVMVGAAPDEGLRLNTARALGFETVLTAGKDNVEQAVKDLTGGIGADLVIDCSGAPRAIAGLPALARKKGTLCAIGLTGGRPVEFPWDDACKKVLDLVFCMSTSYTCWDRALSLLATGLVKPESIITHRLPLAKWEEAFAAIEDLSALKVILHP